MLLQDWISFKPEVSSGVLNITDGEITVGIVEEFGQGYYSDSGSY